MDGVRIGLIGCGGFQRYRVGNLFQVPDAQVVALVDPDPSQIERMRKAHPSLSDTPAFADYKEMLEKVPLDAVMIATPHTQHFGQIIDSLEAGKNVLCEKPLVTSVDHAHQAIAALKRAQKVGMVSYQRHFQAEFRWMRERIQSGSFGKVQFVQALQGQEWKVATKGTWRQDPGLSGGGQLNDSGSHLVDILLWVTGLKADTVCTFGDNRGTAVDINTTISMRFDGGALGSMSIVGDAPQWYEDITIWCDGGAFYMRNGKLSFADEKGNRFAAENLQGGGTPDRNFVESILGRAQVEAPFECGLRVIELTEAAWKSAAEGGMPISVGSS